MRVLVVLAWLAFPVVAMAAPRLAIAPIDGDRGGKLADAIADALGDDVELIRAKRVDRAVEAIGMSADPSIVEIKKLASKLGADVVVHGVVRKDTKDDGRTTARLAVTLRGKKPSTFEVTYKATRSDKLRQELRSEITRRMGDDFGGREPAQDPPDVTENRTDPEDRTDPDTEPRVERKPRATTLARRDQRQDRRDDEVDDQVDRSTATHGSRHALTQSAIRVSIGGAFARRTLTYDATDSSTRPPRVGTAGAAVRLDAEIYPLSRESVNGIAARLGVAVRAEKTFGVSIEVPGGAGTAPIDQMRYAVGVRYRHVLGRHSVAAGVGYWRRRYAADRSSLTAPSALDAPDVSYRAIAPVIVARIAAGRRIAVQASLEVPLMRSTGSIQKDASYGPADIKAFDLEIAGEVQLAARYAIRLVAELGQVGHDFTQRPGTMSAVRGVEGATDRVLGGAASLVVLY